MGCHFFLQGIFLTEGWNLGLPHPGGRFTVLATREALLTPLGGASYTQGKPHTPGGAIEESRAPGQGRTGLPIGLHSSPEVAQHSRICLEC